MNHDFFSNIFYFPFRYASGRLQYMFVDDIQRCFEQPKG